MTNGNRHQTAITVTVLTVVIAFLYAVRSTLPPFLIAFAIAWLLDPVVDRLQKRGLARIWSVLAIYAIFLAAFIVGLLFLVPAVIDQAKQFGADFPRYSARFQDYVSGVMVQHHDTLARLKLPTTLRDVFVRYGDQMSGQFGSAVSLVTAWITANLSRALWFVLVPIIAFYLLMDIDRMRAKSALLIPSNMRPRAVELLSRVGAVFSGYVRGLITVCLMYGIATTIVLEVLHMRYGIILGLLAGILYAVPYLGAITISLLAFLVGLATYDNALPQALLAVGAMVALNQVFDMAVTPRILGKSVGLHPALSLFALLSGAKLFGLVGMILAVPVAASIQEVIFEFCPELKAEPKPPRKSRLRRRKKPAAE
ncbi:MAG: AI-2E family transporter [Armatimonadetes bacterium]|nr:AI-2E family transporter [Armatimonadota bacterium]